MTSNLNGRIERMFGADRRMAITFVVCLWLIVGFVFFAVSSFTDDPGIRSVLLVGALAVLVFNTAAIVAMLRHYAEDKHFIYDIDIRHLDEYRARKAAARSGALADQPGRP